MRKPAYVSINAQVIRRNATKGTDDPPIRIARLRNDRKPRYAHEVEIDGPSRLVYDKDNRILACGARLVLQTYDDCVKVIR